MVGMIINISDRKDTKVLLYSNTLSVEIKFHGEPAEKEIKKNLVKAIVVSEKYLYLCQRYQTCG